MTTSQVPNVLFSIVYIVGFALIASLYLASIVWAFQDGRARGKSGGLVALLVAFLAWPLGLIAWVLMRYQGARRPIRLKIKPRFSLSALLILVALTAIVLAYFVSTATYEAVALVRFPYSFGDPTNVGLQTATGQNYAYAKELVIQKLASEVVVDKAVHRVTGKKDPLMVQTIRKRLDVSNPGNSEVVRVSLRGHVFRHDSDVYVDILNSIIECYIETAEDDRAQLIQTAVIP